MVARKSAFRPRQIHNRINADQMQKSGPEEPPSASCASSRQRDSPVGFHRARAEDPTWSREADPQLPLILLHELLHIRYSQRPVTHRNGVEAPILHNNIRKVGSFRNRQVSGSTPLVGSILSKAQPPSSPRLRSLHAVLSALGPKNGASLRNKLAPIIVQLSCAALTDEPSIA
jgi:hypothetical protein